MCAGSGEEARASGSEERIGIGEAFGWTGHPSTLKRDERERAASLPLLLVLVKVLKKS
jgi:hypothetical protein